MPIEFVQIPNTHTYIHIYTHTPAESGKKLLPSQTMAAVAVAYLLVPVFIPLPGETLIHCLECKHPPQEAVSPPMGHKHSSSRKLNGGGGASVQCSAFHADIA